MKFLSKRAQVVANLQGFIMAIVTIAVVLAIGLFVLQSVGNSVGGINNGVGTITGCGLNSTGGTLNPVYTNCSAAYTSTENIITQLGNAPTWIGLLIVVVFASAILAYFYFRQ